MFKKLIVSVLVLAIMVPAVASAKDLTGRFGLGYFHSDAPVGLRYWVNDKVGLDIGVGFESRDLGEESASSFWIEAGVPYIVYPSDRANFYVRPGIVYASLDDRVHGTGAYDETWSVITLKLMPGAEVFFGDHFSLQAAHGFEVTLSSPPDEVSDESTTDIKTTAASISYLGFHFYF